MEDIIPTIESRSHERNPQLNELYALIRGVATNVASTKENVSSTKDTVDGTKVSVTLIKAEVDSTKKNLVELRMMMLDHIDKEENLYREHEDVLQKHVGMITIQSEAMKRSDLIISNHAEAIGELAGLHQAIPLDPITGKRDIVGHHNDHITRMQEATEAKRRLSKTKDTIAEVLVKGATYALIFLLMTGVVEYIKHPFVPSVEQVKGKE